MKIFVDENTEERYAQGLYEDYLKEQLEEKNKEIERLNNIIKQKDNIISELEKYFAKPNKFIERPERMKILDKLKELKEGK